MKRFALFFLLCVVATTYLPAQISPPQGAKLNYNQVLFECKKVNNASEYLFQVAENFNVPVFGNAVVEQRDSSTATIINGLQFGKKYQWRYAGLVRGQQLEWHGPYYFEISGDKLLLNNLSGFSVTINDSSANAGGLIMNDYENGIYDRNGKLVWYLPENNPDTIAATGSIKTQKQLFDLRLTPVGTITYLTNNDAIECNLNGHTLWKGPDNGKVSGGPVEYYNHQFVRLANGHYMVLGNQMLLKPGHYEPAFVEKKDLRRIQFQGKEYTVIKFGTIIEYNKQGDVVWQWKSTKYFGKDSVTDLAAILPSDFYLNAHINSFSVDPDNKFVYAGFRNVSRIIKIEKSTGRVVQSWGQKLPADKSVTAVNFYRQHDCHILDDHEMVVLNSNDYHKRDSFPTVMVFSTNPLDNGKVTWKYVCKFDTIDGIAQQNAGNVDRLTNGNFMVCTGSTNHMFEISTDKRIVWNATAKLNNTGPGHRLYRAHYISSLYPCYFTARSNIDTVAASFPHFNELVFNSGTESDVYKIKISSLSGAFIKEITSPVILPKTSFMVEVKPDGVINAGDNIQVTVTSKTNPILERKNVVVVNLRFPQ